MNFNSKHFIYDGINSRRYGLQFLHIDTEPLKKVSGTPTYQKNFYNNKKSNSIIGIVWDESPINTEVEFISEKPISKKEKREIEKWLFNRSQYCKLYIDAREDKEIEIIDGQQLQCYVECIFYEPEIIEFASGVHGFKSKMELASPFATQDSLVKTFNSNSDTDYTELTVNIDTDDNDYVYPFVILDCSNNIDTSEIEIKNISDNERIVKISDYERTVFSDFQDVQNSINNDIKTYIFRDSSDDNGLKRLYYSFADASIEPDNNNFFKLGENLSSKKFDIKWRELSQEIFNTGSFNVQTEVYTEYGWRIFFSMSINDSYDTSFLDITIYNSDGDLFNSYSKTSDLNTTTFSLPSNIGRIALIQNLYFIPESQRVVVKKVDGINVLVNELCKITCPYNGEEIYWFDDNGNKQSVNRGTKFYWETVLTYISVNKIAGKTMFLNCETGSIINNDGDNCYDCLSDQKFLRLCNGENKLKIKGKTNITLKYQQKRYLR